MINGLLSLDKFRSAEEFNELVKLAKEDNHGVYAPTDVIRRWGDNKLVGYISFAPQQVGLTFAWFSTKEISARESFHLINEVESIARKMGHKFIVWPIPTCSPFYPLMEELGYRNGGTYDFFMKDL